MARSLQRDRAGEPTRTMFGGSVYILGGHSAAKQSNIIGYLLTFDPDVWMYLAFSMLLLSFISSLIMVALRRIREMNGRFLSIWNDYLQMFFENMFCEASPETPRETPIRILVGVWWIAVVVLMNAFAGQMRACLLVKSEVPKIKTVQEVANRAATAGLVPYGLANNEAAWFIQHSSRPDYQKLFAMMKRHGSLIDRLYAFSDKMLMEVSTGKAVIIHVETILRIGVSAFCKKKQVGEFYFADETINTWRFVLYVSDKLPQPLKQRIDQFVARYDESGLTPHHLEYTLPSIDHCAVLEEDGVLRFSDTYSIFWMWGACCLLSLTVFTLELLVARCERHS
ncbi:uncharacterized protein LOC142588659 [Dermacentor variabilis]|uniref:uncharacterized protein LOC142588659 n=1 Tax=Dermacentor variabilis TaxID=34621 RepID=UPI003F5C0BBF